jgi:hypothetical protein
MDEALARFCTQARLADEGQSLKRKQKSMGRSIRVILFRASIF